MGTVYAYVWSLLYCWHVEYSTCLLLVHLLPLSLPSLSPSHTNTFVVDSFAHSSWICERDLFLKNLMKSVAWLYFFFFFSNMQSATVCLEMSLTRLPFSRPIVVPRLYRFLKVYYLLSSTKELAYQKICTSGDLFWSWKIMNKTSLLSF